MQEYLFINDKESHFINADNDIKARDKVINTFDLSFNPYLFKLIEKTYNNFTVCTKRIDFLNIKKHFTLISVGNNIATFKI